MSFPTAGDASPTRGNRLTRGFWRAFLKVQGWRFEGTLPNVARGVVIAAPHTSNWDFVVAMSTLLALGLDVRWVGKHTLFRPPFGWLMRWLGGMPVDRSRRQGAVGQIVAVFEDRERLLVGMSPEGTRRRVERWKTGFYHIALGAGVPILPAFFDYPRKVVGVGPLFWPTGNLEADVAALQAFYHDKGGKKPEQF